MSSNLEEIVSRCAASVEEEATAERRAWQTWLAGEEARQRRERLRELLLRAAGYVGCGARCHFPLVENPTDEGARSIREPFLVYAERTGRCGHGAWDWNGAGGEVAPDLGYELSKANAYLEVAKRWVSDFLIPTVPHVLGLYGEDWLRSYVPRDNVLQVAEALYLTVCQASDRQAVSDAVRDTAHAWKNLGEARHRLGIYFSELAALIPEETWEEFRRSCVASGREENLESWLISRGALSRHLGLENRSWQSKVRRYAPDPVHRSGKRSGHPNLYRVGDLLTTFAQLDGRELRPLKVTPALRRDLKTPDYIPRWSAEACQKLAMDEKASQEAT